MIKQDQYYLQSYERTIAKARVHLERFMQDLEFQKMKSNQTSDHVVAQIKKLKRLINSFDKKINFYKDLIWNLNL